MKKVIMFFVAIILSLSLLACKDDNKQEKKYVPFEIKVVDGVGGEWILTEETAKDGGELRLSFNDGKGRKFVCTYFRILETIENYCWWDVNKWNKNYVKMSTYIERDVSYKKSSLDYYSKKEDGIVDAPGYYEICFRGNRNGVWNDYLEYTILVEVQE